MATELLGARASLKRLQPKLAVAYNDGAALRHKLSVLQAASQAVLDRWDTPNWKVAGVFIEALRTALDRPEDGR